MIHKQLIAIVLLLCGVAWSGESEPPAAKDKEKEKPMPNVSAPAVGRKIPPIDAQLPAKIETITFAVG